MQMFICLFVLLRLVKPHNTHCIIFGKNPTKPIHVCQDLSSVCSRSPRVDFSSELSLEMSTMTALTRNVVHDVPSSAISDISVQYESGSSS